MKKILEYFFVTAAVLLAASCAKPEEEFLHTNNTITDIWITPVDDATRTIYGTIDDTVDPAVILFEIPRASRPFFPSLSELKVRAIVGYDAIITPSLLGIKDLSSDLSITVTATQTGETKEYILRARYLSN